jgi:hypothetical protein
LSEAATTEAARWRQRDILRIEVSLSPSFRIVPHLIWQTPREVS